ncbi:MAG: hypothetical protein WBV55_18845 [Candidatus Sulfotelmatobacter sp.]
MSQVPKSVLRLLEKRAEIAFKEAVEGGIDEHARLGLPLYIWRDGEVVGLSAQELPHDSAVHGK